jgi:hypothetical protein
LLRGLEDKGHYVVMDNYFCSIPLFRIWQQREFMQQALFGPTELDYLHT